MTFTFFICAALSAASSFEDTIVVTASRSPSLLAEEPLSVSVVDQGAASFTLAHHPAELLASVPGALIQAGSGQEHLTALRSPVLTGGAGAGSFLYLQDGVPLRSSGFANVNGLFDAQTEGFDRIEVVRGPGEVTYGSNALHGAINVISPDPLQAEGGSLAVDAGAFDRYRLMATQGGGGFYGQFSAYKDGGYRATSGVDQIKGQLAHGALRGQTTLRSRLSFHQLEQETAGFVPGDDAFESEDLRRSNPNPDAFRNVKHLLFSSEVKSPLAGGNITIIPYILWTDMEFLMHFLPSQALEENRHAAGGLLSSFEKEMGATQLLIGGDIEIAKGALSEIQEIPDIFSFTQGVHYDYEVSSKSVAPFVRLRHQLTQRLSVQGGVRLTYTDYRYENKTDDGVVGRFLRLPDRRDDFAVFTWKGAALYAVNDRLSVRASLARGGRPPQTTDLYRLQRNQTIEGIEPETLDMAEIGVRYQHPQFSADIVAFQGQKENFLFRDADGFTVDDGVTTHQGVEVSTRWSPSPRWQVYGNGTWAQHEYDFTRIVGRASEIILPGNEVDTAPSTLGQVGVVFTPSLKWRSELVLTHVGAYFTDAANENSYPGHEVLDLRLGYQLSDRWQLAAAIKNLTDERYATRADFAFGNERYFPGEERHVTASLRTNW